MKLNKFLNELYREPLEKTHDMLAPHIPGSSRFFEYLQPLLYSTDAAYIVIILFDILPKVTIAFIFLVEIAFLGRVSLFIYALFLLLIPIGFSIFLKLYQSFALRNIPDLQQYFEYIKGIGKISPEGYYKSYESKVKTEYENEVDADLYITIIIRLSKFNATANFIRETLAEITPYITIITSTIYIVSGIIRLILLL